MTLHDQRSRGLRCCLRALSLLTVAFAMAVSASVYAQQPGPAPAAPAEGPALAAPAEGQAGGTAGKSATELAKELQSPVADLISFPFQNNTNFNYGPLKGTQNILDIQPVIPFHLTEDWNLITRTIFPLTWQPQLAPNTGSTFGLGNVNLSLFLSGPGATTLPVHIFSEIQWGGDPTIAAASALQIVVIGLLILAVQRLFRLRPMI